MDDNTNKNSEILENGSRETLDNTSAPIRTKQPKISQIQSLMISLTRIRTILQMKKTMRKNRYKNLIMRKKL